jgi:hypothetical protein
MVRHQVRTTLSLDDDVLASARVLARQRGESLGAVISELARKGLHQPLPQSAGQASRRNELLLLPLCTVGGCNRAGRLCICSTWWQVHTPALLAPGYKTTSSRHSSAQVAGRALGVPPRGMMQ